MSTISNDDDLYHSTKVLTNHDRYHFISGVSSSNLFQKTRRERETIKFIFYELHH